MPRQDKNMLFRRQALARLDDIDELDRLVTVTNPRAWLTLGAVAAIIIAALVWASFSKLDTAVNGEGILLSGGYVMRVTSPDAGQLDSLSVALGQHVTAGQTVAVLVTDTGQTSSQAGRTEVVSPYTGMVVSLQAYPGQFLTPGAPVITIEPLSAPLEATLYLPVDAGKQVRPGQEVQITPATVSVDKYGFMLARVSYVAQLPSTPESMQAVLQNDFLVQQFSAAGPVIRVEATLVPDRRNRSGYAWSTSSGPSYRISTGTSCTARIVLSSSPPITYVFPSLKSYLGGAN
jgi:multidrug efflux pump subunit AcrA (membrane-fusion protein)